MKNKFSSKEIIGLLRAVVPPFLVAVARNIRSRLSGNNSNFPSHTNRSMEFKSYEDALRFCSNKGYENSELVDVVVNKTLRFKNQIDQDPQFDLNALRVLAALGLSCKKKQINVIDFGGASGYHYFIASKVFGESVRLRWTVVETSEMARKAKIHAVEDLEFFNRVEGAKESLGNVDLVFSSGALHCCPNPLSSLQEILNVNADFVFITRTALSERNQSVVRIQKSMLSENGPGLLMENIKDVPVAYPVVFASRKSFEGKLSERYEIQFKVDEGIAYRFGNETVEMYSYFCARKALV
jgi:putative methyltransferase (TIGR04325 family)